jgi:hypothetical protein
MEGGGVIGDWSTLLRAASYFHEITILQIYDIKITQFAY